MNSTQPRRVDIFQEIRASDHVFEAALSFVDVDQVGDDNYERLSAHGEAMLRFVRILLDGFSDCPG